MVCSWEFLVLYNGCLKSIAALFGSDLAAGKSISHGLGTQEETELGEAGRAKKGEDERTSCHSLKETYYYEFSRIFFQKTSLTITWLECTSPSTLILIIGQSWNLNHLPCHFHPRLLPHVGLEGQRRRNGYRPLESRCQGREGWEAVGMTSLQFFLKNVLFNGKVVN